MPRVSERKNKGVAPKRYTPSAFELQPRKQIAAPVRETSSIVCPGEIVQSTVGDGGGLSQTAHSSEKVDVTGLYTSPCKSDLFTTPNGRESIEPTKRYTKSLNNLLKPGQKIGIMSLGSGSSKSSSQSSKSVNQKYAEIELQRRLAAIEFEKKQMEADFKMKEAKLDFEIRKLELTDTLSESSQDLGSIKHSRTKSFIVEDNRRKFEENSREIFKKETVTGVPEIEVMDSAENKKLSKVVQQHQCQSNEVIIHEKFTDVLNKLIDKMPSGESSQISKIIARQANRDLPTFTGNMEEWPLFISEFRRSTEEGQFNNSENLRRLDKSIRGPAREAVSALFISPNNVEDIIDTLQANFGRPEWIMLNLLNKARSVGTPKEDRIETYIAYANTVTNLVVTAESIGEERFLENPEIILSLVSKLSPSLRLQWGFYADLHGGDVKTFARWVRVIINLKCSTSYPDTPKPEKSTTQHLTTARFSVQPKKEKLFVNSEKSVTETPMQSLCCNVCGSAEHKLETCDDFIKLEVNLRWEVVKKLGLCFSCLGTGHRTEACKKKKKCSVDKCQQNHHQLLHVDIKVPAVDNREVLPIVNHHGHESHNVLLRTVRVKISGPKGTLVTTALCDEASTITMMDRSFADQLGIHGECQPLCFQWTNNVTRQDNTSEKVELKIAADVDGAKVFTLKGVRTIADLALPHQKFNINEMLERYDYLNGAGDVSRVGDIAPMILIGQDHISLTIPRETIEHEENEPMATNCKLGWSVHGSGLTSFIENFNYHVCERTDTDDLHLLVKNSFKLEDSCLHVDDSKLSREDSKALDIMEKSIKYDGNRYEIGMLWKDENAILPESRSNALKRLYCLEKKLDKNKEFSIRYCQKINEYVQKNYARKVESPQPSLKEWYLPHFGVFNIHKPEKLRLVFDAASKSKNVCLNDFLLQGPDLVPPLIAVIWRFRRNQVAFGGDIREMFHQVKIDQVDWVAQRFLFRGMDRDRPPDTYEMMVMIFGSVSSPSVAQFVKNFNAKQFENEDLDEAMIKQHYVDDYLDGTNTEEEAVIKIKKIIEVHKAGGFEMVNWISNSKSVLDTIPEGLVSNDVKNLKIDDTYVERVLGLFWNPVDDSFTFSVSFKKVDADIVNGNRTPTKRQVLQVLMSVFDPLQFLGPIIIKGKILLQDIWRSGIDWDDIIGESLQEKWLVWLREVKQIDKFKIPRCYFRSGEEVGNLQLHLFSDASEKAYAAVAYFRFKSNNLYRTSFVTGKTRVAPLKNLTIPRMELQAAVLASRLAATILKECDMPIEEVFFWCDSTIVLSWIRSEAKRFKMYVGVGFRLLIMLLIKLQGMLKQLEFITNG